MLAEARRILRPDGLVVVCEPDWSFLTVGGIATDLADVIAEGIDGVARAVRALIVAGFDDVQATRHSMRTTL